MPVNTKARYYTWYMSDDPSNRILAFQWWPRDGRITSSMGVGKLLFIKREDPSDVWEPPVTIQEEIMWVVAQSLARREGFNVEVAEVRLMMTNAQRAENLRNIRQTLSQIVDALERHRDELWIPDQVNTPWAEARTHISSAIPDIEDALEQIMSALEKAPA